MQKILRLVWAVALLLLPLRANAGFERAIEARLAALNGDFQLHQRDLKTAQK